MASVPPPFPQGFQNPSGPQNPHGRGNNNSGGIRAGNPTPTPSRDNLSSEDRRRLAKYESKKAYYEEQVKEQKKINEKWDKLDQRKGEKYGEKGWEDFCKENIANDPLIAACFKHGGGAGMAVFILLTLIHDGIAKYQQRLRNQALEGFEDKVRKYDGKINEVLGQETGSTLAPPLGNGNGNGPGFSFGDGNGANQPPGLRLQQAAAGAQQPAIEVIDLTAPDDPQAGTATLGAAGG